MKNIFLTVLCMVCIVGVLSRVAHAQESLSLSVTPPLFQLNITPGEAWKSSIKVINSNPFELTVYAERYDFEPKGEDGQGAMNARTAREAGDPGTLADWISVPAEAIIIPPEQSAMVPITVVVPADASPGGHSAAILIGTRPPPEKRDVSAVRTSQVVTSLFFVRVAGDVEEKGAIREFSVAHLFREVPEATFAMRFENLGNVHLQPQGGITIYNMWGKERGYIPINQKSHFGNVLPQSIRKFDFSWRGEESIADIGHYTAEVAVTYGQDGRQTASSKLYFWVIPVRATLITLFALGLFLYFIVWIIRRYVRRAMYLAGYEAMPERNLPERPKNVQVNKKKALALPLQEGVLDLRRSMQRSDMRTSLFSSLLGYLRVYKFFFVGLSGIVCIAVVLGVYFSDVLQKSKKYEVTVTQGTIGTTLSSEEVVREQLHAEEFSGQEINTDEAAQPFDIEIINTSDTPGVAARAALILEKAKYQVKPVLHESESAHTASLIFFSAGLEEEARRVSDLLQHIPISPLSNATSTVIRVFLGADIQA